MAYDHELFAFSDLVNYIEALEKEREIHLNQIKALEKRNEELEKGLKEFYEDVMKNVESLKKGIAGLRTTFFNYLENIDKTPPKVPRDH